MLWETFIHKASKASASDFEKAYGQTGALIFTVPLSELSSKFLDTPERSPLPSLLDARTRLDLPNFKNPKMLFAGNSIVTIPMDKKVVIGRDSKCDIVVSSKGVSRQHVKVTHFPKIGWILSDLCSRNGTFLNEVKCGAGPYNLNDNDVFQLSSDACVIFKTFEGLEELVKA